MYKKSFRTLTILSASFILSVAYAAQDDYRQNNNGNNQTKPYITSEDNNGNNQTKSNTNTNK